MRLIILAMAFFTLSASASYYRGRLRDPRDPFPRPRYYSCFARDKAKPPKEWAVSGDPYYAQEQAYQNCRKQSKKRSTCYKVGCAYF